MCLLERTLAAHDRVQIRAMPQMLDRSNADRHGLSSPRRRVRLVECGGTRQIG